jgi:hypothetical protein
MSEEKQIPPQSEWKNLNTTQLLDIKNDLLNRYYDLRSINASFAGQFLSFSRQVDSIIALKEAQLREEAHR